MCLILHLYSKGGLFAGTEGIEGQQRALQPDGSAGFVEQFNDRLDMRQRAPTMICDRSRNGHKSQPPFDSGGRERNAIAGRLFANQL
jgi:hypothetical protein